MLTYDKQRVSLDPSDNYVKNLKNFGLDLRHFDLLVNGAEKQLSPEMASSAFMRPDFLSGKAEQDLTCQTPGWTSWTDDKMGLFLADTPRFGGVSIETVACKNVLAFGVAIDTQSRREYVLRDRTFQSGNLEVSFLAIPQGSNFRILMQDGGMCSVTLLFDADVFLKKLSLSLDALPEVVQKLLMMEDFYFGKLALSTKIHRIAEDIIKFRGTNAHLSPLYYEGKSCELMLALMEYLQGQEKLLPDNDRLTDKDIQNVQKVKDFIDRDPITDLTIDQLGRMAGMNRTKLRFVFRNLFGVTISQHRRSLFMSYAQRMLQTTEITVSELAYEMGYADASSFIVAYKKYFGYSPSYTRPN